MPLVDAGVDRVWRVSALFAWGRSDGKARGRRPRRQVGHPFASITLEASGTVIGAALCSGAQSARCGASQ